MLPSFLYPSYKQYKNDTDDVASWLADTAKRCGYPSDLLNKTTSQPLQKAPKLKGRARKLARDASKTNKANIQDTDGESRTAPKAPQYLISVNDFIALAHWIVKSTKPPVVIPSTFVTTLERAIAVRKNHVDWWGNEDKGSINVSKNELNDNERHNYFVGVLEQVRDILRPCMVSKSPDETLLPHLDDVSASSKSPDDQFANQFAGIQIEHPHDEVLDPLMSSGHQPGSINPDKTYGVQQPSDLEEVFFAVDCLFNDFDNIRRYLQQVWKGYKEGVFHLIAASITTDTAIDFVRHLHEDFIEMFPEHTDFREHISILLARSPSSKNCDIGYKERPDDEMNFEMYAEADKLFFPTYMLVSSFKDITKFNPVPIFKPGLLGVYNASSKRDQKSSREKFHEDKILLMESLPDFYVFAQGCGKIPAEDAMTRGVREMMKQDRPPFWLIFAAQIFLDIHHILREKVGAGFSELVRSAQYVENSIQQVMKFHENLRIETWPKFNDKGLEQILALIKTWVKTDTLQVMRSKLTNKSGIPVPPLESYRFLKNHPLYCGLLSFSIKALAQEASILFANAWKSIMYSAHLYNALRQERLLSNSWKDMDFVFYVHDTQNMFIGDYPDNIVDYTKRLALVMGGSVTMFAKDNRKKGWVASKAGSRRLDVISPVSAIFKSLYCKTDDRLHLSPADVEIILRTHNDPEEDTIFNDTGKWTMPRIKVNVEEPPSPAITNEEKLGGRKEKGRKDPRQSGAAVVRPIQLLNALLQATGAEIAELSFDHFRLHIFCWKLLRAVQEALHEDLENIYGAGYVKENRLPQVVAFILTTAAMNTPKLAGNVPPSRKDILTTRCMLTRAAEVMKETLDSGKGEIELKLLKDELGLNIIAPDYLEPFKSWQKT